MLFDCTLAGRIFRLPVLMTVLLLMAGSLARGSEVGDWAWMTGSSRPGVLGIYGSQGMAGAGVVQEPDNTPGGRFGGVTWTDREGNRWVFGGQGRGPVQSSVVQRNDLWKHDAGTNNWIWMKGSTEANQAGVYGTVGVTEPNNGPGARVEGVSWVDGQGNLWMLGGYGYGTQGGTYGYLSDLWKYDTLTNQWTWMKGNNALNQPGNYGAQGAAGPSYRPGARIRAVTWTDAQGKLWLYGGYGYGVTSTLGLLCDLWKYDPVTNQWSFERGFNNLNEPGLYGALGSEASTPRPGAREGSVVWTDNQGMLWLFGGIGFGSSTQGFLNDLWRFNPTNKRWTWMKGSSGVNQQGVYGTKGVAAATNAPGARVAAQGWKDGEGRFWLMGGTGYNGTGSTGRMNDLWRYDPATSQWTWIHGSSAYGQVGVYGTLGVADGANVPGSRERGMTWTDGNGRLWLFGGYGTFANGDGFFNDLWMYDIAGNSWTWMKGGTARDQVGVYGTQGEPENRPGSRQDGVSWTGMDGSLWMFGGYGLGFEVGSTEGLMNDVWKYDPVAGKWIWMKGNPRGNAFANYGTQGMPNGGNTPGARQWSASWTDGQGKFWMFGGMGYKATGGQARMNDLWRFDPVTRDWTWMKGSNNQDQPSVYGTQGVAEPDNTPGARRSSASWTDGQGNLWLFGGEYWSELSRAQLNDLWKYDPLTNNWAWMKGSTTQNPVGIYGTQGQGAAENTPGARQDCVTWTDGDGNLWLFGGYGIGASAGIGYLNDLWKFDTATNHWTWMKGDNSRDRSGNYGVMGVAAPENKPGGRRDSVGWRDGQGNLWVFGGFGMKLPSIGMLSDLWKYDPRTNNWTWMKGLDAVNETGIYDRREMATPANRPGARHWGVSWTRGNTELWMFGGYGMCGSTLGLMNDLWRLDISHDSEVGGWELY